ncbi:hypothetical protein HC725_02040 [Vibrio sp. S17_S38]|uniref:hypothetical protein n=1 Tax=Vibrio sp. S17_S38 TaxID=2720229 RepID=UPI00168038D0|nr:hypothetical protein [Vibrio sp. S17_S38]MBD1572059.1 hypothetical protein [Vibrio sp. S17_S38]
MTNSDQLQNARSVISPTAKQQEIGLKWIEKIKADLDVRKKPQNKFQQEYQRRKQVWRERLRENANQLQPRKPTDPELEELLH